MSIRKYTLPTPFSRLPGDEIRIVGNRVDVIRGGLVVQTWNLTSLASELLTAAAFVGGSELNSIFVESRYMALKTLTGWQVNETSGVVTAKFSDGNQIEFGTHADGLAMADALDANGSLAETILIATAYRHSPDGTALADAIGSTCAIDTAAASNPIIFTPSPELA